MLFLRETILCLLLTILLLSVVLRYFEVRFSDDFVSDKTFKNAPKKYLVESAVCKIPDFNPFDLTTFHSVFQDKSSNINFKPPLTYLHYDLKSGVTSLKINTSVLELYVKNFTSGNSSLNCCVSMIYDDYWPTIQVGKCTPFNDTFTLDLKHEMINVKCYTQQNVLLYQHSHITVAERLNKSRRKNNSTSKLNVLLIGLDSISRLDMYRQMPKTVWHLHSSSWVEMRGYNKIGDNTLPNLMALLSGLPPEHFVDLPGNSVFDNYPFIWRRFHSQGYVTAYVEDNVDIETFNGYNKGFFRKPTDYYPRSFFSLREKQSRMSSKENYANFQGSENVVFRYLYDFVRTYKDDYFFGLFYTNSFHNGLKSPSFADDSVLELLKLLESLGVFNNTFVALFSDHGMRVGEIRTATTGWYEDRLPLLFVSVPQWFELQNKRVCLNLLDNSERLTSPFDLYMTLSNILTEDPAPPKGCAKCKSLFDTLEENRSCSEAGISRHWCTCNEFLDFEIDEKRKYLFGIRVVKAINTKLQRDKNIKPMYKCKPLKLSQVLYVRKRRSSGGFDEFLVGVRTEPGGGVFEMTVDDLEHDGRQYDTISRLNQYGNASHCASKPITKLFCFCELLGSSSIVK